MPSEPLDESYFKWLYSHVANPRSRSKQRTYWDLLRAQYTTEFIWLIPNDDNRVEDGRVLRVEFLDGAEPDPLWFHLPCSFLEMAIALSRRLAFEGGGTTSEWFWQLMKNLSLEGCTDASESSPDYITHVLNTVIWRTYKRSGEGGLFPLAIPLRDQRTVELWYQMQSYLLENGFV